jgi:hypothetical protein
MAGEHRFMTDELAREWGSFLAGYPWDWFVTLTFREPPGSFRAHRIYDRFTRDIQRAANVPIGWFRADEYGAIGGHLHIHALMLNTGHLSRMAWLNEWNRRAGFARILPFDATKGAAFYCSKYVTKEFGDYDFSDNIEAFRRTCPAIQPLLSYSSESLSIPVPPLPRPPLAVPSKPQFRNTAEEELIAKIEGAGPIGPDDEQPGLFDENDKSS